MPVSCEVIKYKAQELDQTIQQNTASYTKASSDWCVHVMWSNKSCLHGTTSL